MSRRVLAVILTVLSHSVFRLLECATDNAALREETARRLTLAEAAQTQAKDREARIAAELRDAQAKLALLEARLAESQSQQASLEALYRELSPSRDDLSLNEVEQILLIANQQLASAGTLRPRWRRSSSRTPSWHASIVRCSPFAANARARRRSADGVALHRRCGNRAELDQSVALVGTAAPRADERLPAPTASASGAERAKWRRLLDRHRQRAAIAGPPRNELTAAAPVDRPVRSVFCLLKTCDCDSCRRESRSSRDRRPATKPTSRGARLASSYFDSRTPSPCKA